MKFMTNNKIVKDYSTFLLTLASDSKEFIFTKSISNTHRHLCYTLRLKESLAKISLIINLITPPTSIEFTIEN